MACLGMDRLEILFVGKAHQVIGDVGTQLVVDHRWAFSSCLCDGIAPRATWRGGRAWGVSNGVAARSTLRGSISVLGL